jgi:hypothetical protein
MEMLLRQSRGSMLVVAMGVLALMSIMAVTFTTLVRLEMASSSNYVNGIKAKFTAESGISYATVELRGIASARGYTDNSNATRERWIIREDLIGQPIEDIVQGTYEGTLGGTYVEGGDRYKVKIIDCASQINLNTHYGTSRQILARMLDNLGLAIQAKTGKNPLGSYRYRGYGGGEALLVFRDSELPGGAFISKSQLIEPLGKDNYSLLEDYVTVSSWIDPQTVRCAVGSIDVNDPRSAVELEVDPRAPVNINTATREVLIACLTGLAGRRVYVKIPKPVMQLTGIADPVKIPGVPEEISIEEPTLSFIYTDPITFGDASIIADRIIEARKTKPFKEWQSDKISTDMGWRGFYDFVDNMSTAGFQRLFTIPSSVGPDLIAQPKFKEWYEKSVRSVLKANFNPNVLPNRFNPNKGAFQEIDKLSLFRLEGGNPQPSYTTEFCFSPMGRFEIISLGEIAGPNDILARSKIRKVVKLSEVVRHTTQAQFEENVGENLGLTRYDVVTYPEPCSVLGTDHASRQAGYVEIKHMDEGSSSTQVFRADWETKREPLQDSLWADSAAYPTPMPPDDPNNAMTVGPLIKLGRAPYNEYGDLFTDGVNTSIIRHNYPRILRYRAGVTSPAKFAGPSAEEGGNVPYLSGGLEFWFKPMFDATQEVIWGLCGITMVKSQSAGIWTEGIQMFMFKNADGIQPMLRVVRLYFGRAFDDMLSAHPSLKDAAAQADTRIKYARTDAVASGVVKSWNSNEWRHIAIGWDSTFDVGGASRLDIYVDGKRLSSTISPPGDKEGAFVTLNEKKPRDVMYVGGFERYQAYGAGVFKYGDPAKYKDPAVSEFCNGTIDGFRVLSSSPDFTITPMRFYPMGHYENRVPVIFPPNVSETRIGSVSWTSYLPSDYRGCLKKNFKAGSVKVKIQVRTDAPRELKNGEEILLPNLIVFRGDPVKYIVDFEAVQIPGQGQGNVAGNVVCSPVFDDITVTYVLPEVVALEYEEIFE